MPRKTEVIQCPRCRGSGIMIEIEDHVDIEYHCTRCGGHGAPRNDNPRSTRNGIWYKPGKKGSGKVKAVLELNPRTQKWDIVSDEPYSGWF